MSDLFQSVNSMTETENGALSLSTSADAVVDFFFAVGASRGDKNKAIAAFNLAAASDEDAAIRTLLWARDAREGAGERQTFRDILTWISAHTPTRNLAKRILVRIPELGRWDDVVAMFLDPFVGEAAMSMCLRALAQGDPLCAKWMPREKSKWNKQARAFMAFADLTPRLYRKMLSHLSNTVEQKMCANLWSQIEYNHVPSVAAARYQACFSIKDETRYTEYRERLTTGEAKVNAGAIFPYDVVKGTDATVMEAQWEALPDFMNGNTSGVLPMIDVSGSMTMADLGKNLTPMDVAVSLGLYVAERTEGQFKNQYLSFSEQPRFGTVDRTEPLAARIRDITEFDVGYSTNFQAAFDVILQTAKRFNLTQEQLPSTLLVFSDMEFNQCEGGGFRSTSGSTNYEVLDRKFKDAGYTRPQLVFWNLAGRSGAVPVSVGEGGTALVSGFSPSILKTILANPTDMNPGNIVAEAIGIARYNY